MIAPLTFAALLNSCAPSVAADTMRAIIAVESDGNPYAIHDNTTRRAYFPRSLMQAEELLVGLHSHNLDVGIAQVNAGWFPTFGVTARQMLEPCRNLRIGSVILVRAYREANATFRKPRLALWHAISAYNTGSLYAGASYVAEVINVAISPPIVPSIALLTSSLTDMADTPARRHNAITALPPPKAPLSIYHAGDHNERISVSGSSAQIHQF
jgi:type IV secretion system protein VirB1